MLAQYIRQQQGELPSPGVGSTKVAEYIKEHWKQEGWISEVSTARRTPIWKGWWIGASYIHKVCPRMYALMAAVGPDGMKAETLKAETLWNFGQGKAYHKLFQEEILSSFPSGVLLGRWKNRSMEAVTQYTSYKNELPEGVSLERGWGARPKGKGWVYDEAKMRVPEYRAVVKVDAILDWPDEEGLEVVEIKTEKSEAKDMLNPMLGGRPKDPHVEQVHVAMWATGINRARLIYVFKGEKYLSTSIMEHLVERDESLIERIRARLKSCVDAVKTVEEARNNALSELGCDNIVDADGVVAWDRLSAEDQTKIRASMKAVAEDMSRCPECQMKSKGRPKYCDGRDLCFGVRKRKKK